MLLSVNAPIDTDDAMTSAESVRSFVRTGFTFVISISDLFGVSAFQI